MGHIADAFLHHNRPILRPADDCVYRVIGGKAQPIRLGRGVAPLEFNLPFTLSSPLLAVGGQMKNTIALAWNQRVVISPHIGDLGSPRSQQVFEQTIADLTRLYGVTLKHCVCDAHPLVGQKIPAYWCIKYFIIMPMRLL
ncbi:MAG: carbamoyltransferase HypF [Pseudomonadota bacterium]